MAFKQSRFVLLISKIADFENAKSIVRLSVQAFSAELRSVKPDRKLDVRSQKKTDTWHESPVDEPFPHQND